MSDLGLPKETVGLRLCRVQGETLRLCEPVMFVDGWAAVDTVLRRAKLSGRVEVGGDLEDHFADALNAGGDLIETIALDRQSYGALKNHWMRCRYQRSEPGQEAR